MNRGSRLLWRCAQLGVVACLLVVSLDSAHSSAAPISPIPDGPQTIQLVTVPTVVGATFSLDGTLITTDQSGVATVPIAAARDLSQLTLVSPGSGLDGGTAQFVRMTRAPDKDGLLRAYALFKISRNVSFTFRDSLGSLVPPERVTSLTIKSSIGESFSLTGDALKRPIELPSERSVAFVNGDSGMKEIYYSVQEVVISGTNTVFRSQQKFFPINTSKFEVETVFYTLTIKTSDSLFGFATGSNIVIRWPDQHISKAPIRDGQAVLPALPRGDYDMRVEGPGLNTWRPISVSRDQVVELQLISYLDGFVVLTILLAIAAACVVVGRRRLRASRVVEAEIVESTSDESIDDVGPEVEPIAGSVSDVSSTQTDSDEATTESGPDSHEATPESAPDSESEAAVPASNGVAPSPTKVVAKKRKAVAKKGKAVANASNAVAKA